MAPFYTWLYDATTLPVLPPCEISWLSLKPLRDFAAERYP
jgi:hypothetical protein